MPVDVSKTTIEMINQFLIEYDRIVAQISKSYSDDEIVSFLNRAQGMIVDELYKNRRFDLLGSLFVSDTISSGIGNSWEITNSVYIDLSTNANITAGVKYPVDVSVALTRTGYPSSSGRIKCDPVAVEEAKYYAIDNGNSKMIFREPKVYQKGNYLFVIYDAYSTVTAIYLAYIKEPTKLAAGSPSTKSDLRADLHDDIVTRAAYLAKEATDRLQTKQG